MEPKTNAEKQFQERLRFLAKSSGLADPAVYLIVLLDRSDQAMKEGFMMMHSMDMTGHADMFPPDVRAWFNSPVHGQYLCLILNRIEATSAYLACDDFDELLEGSLPLLEAFQGRSTINGRVAWGPILCPMAKEAFTRWYAKH